MEYPKLELHIGKHGSVQNPVTKEKRSFTIVEEIRKKESQHKIIVLQKDKI